MKMSTLGTVDISLSFKCFEAESRSNALNTPASTLNTPVLHTTNNHIQIHETQNIDTHNCSTLYA